MKTGSCGVCGGETRRGAAYTARSDDDRALVALPGIECTRCGAIQPDAEEVSSLPPAQVPSSVRIRCAQEVQSGMHRVASEDGDTIPPSELGQDADERT